MTRNMRRSGVAAYPVAPGLDVTTGSRNVVAVLDSGIAQDIVDLSQIASRSPYSTKWQTAAPWAWEDIFGHGSGVAGAAVARGDNRVGMGVRRGRH